MRDVLQEVEMSTEESKRKKQQEKITDDACFVTEKVTPPSSLDPALEEAYIRCQNMHDELNKKIDEVYKASGLTPSELNKLLNDPRNFSQKDWEAMQRVKKEADEKLEALKKSAGIEEAYTSPPEGASPEELKKIKSSFLSKKRWLSMH